MLRRGLVLDLSIAGGLGTTFGYLCELDRSMKETENWRRIKGWYGFHMPRVRARDEFYAKLEDQRAKDAGLKWSIQITISESIDVIVRLGGKSSFCYASIDCQIVHISSPDFNFQHVMIISIHFTDPSESQAEDNMETKATIQYSNLCSVTLFSTQLPWQSIPRQGPNLLPLFSSPVIWNQIWPVLLHSGSFSG